MKNYLNITIAISSVGDNLFEARASSTAGEARRRFKPPFMLADIIDHAVGPARWRSLGTVKPIPPEYATARSCGEALFLALFGDDMLEVLARTEEQARARGDTGVRIRLAFDLTNPATAEVAALPWELMRRRNDEPLVVTTGTTLVRALDVPKPIKPRPLIGPLRILVIRSNPEGTGALNLAKESQMLIDTLKGLPDIIVDEAPPVAAAIRKQLQDAEYHVVHYMGHGDFRADRGGMLLLEHEDRSPHLVSADTFAAWLKDEPLRLVFLNACETGTTPDGAGPHPFSGVAAALIQGNAPAVVAMQFPISDSAAIEFASTFYARIAKGSQVDAAVAEGRKALFDGDATEWATPVLYLRPRDGNLFSDGTPEPVPLATEALKPMPLNAPPAPPQRDLVRTFGIAAMGALAVIAFAVWRFGDAGSDQEPGRAEALAAEPTPDLSSDKTPVPIEYAKKAVISAIEKLPPSSWINDASTPFAHEEVMRLAKLSFNEITNEELISAIKNLAENNNPRAQYILERIYDEEKRQYDQMHNTDEATRLYKEAANRNIVIAKHMIGRSYLCAEAGMPKDLQKARNYLEDAAKQGNSEAREIMETRPIEKWCPVREPANG
jgi:hypothetical protein